MYADLGNSCHTSLSVLVSNQKFFPLNLPVYGKDVTNMYRYPAERYPYQKDMRKYNNTMQRRKLEHKEVDVLGDLVVEEPYQASYVDYIPSDHSQWTEVPPSQWATYSPKKTNTKESYCGSCNMK